VPPKRKESKDLGKGFGPAPIPQERPVAALTHPGGKDIVPVPFNGVGDAPATATITDGGGYRLSRPWVNFIFWGSAWAATPAPNPNLVQIANDAVSIMTGPYLSSLDQYRATTSARFAAAFMDTRSNPPNPFTTQNVLNYVTQLIDEGTLPQPYSYSGGDPMHFVMMPPGAAFINPPGFNTGGLHTFLEYEVVLGRSLTVPVAWILFGSRVFISTVFSHELAEACTDPYGDGIQVNPSNPTNWNEIGDVCATPQQLNGVAVQSYWSQRDTACIIPLQRPVRKQITCIRKNPRSDIRHPIRAVGGMTVSLKKNVPFLITQSECIRQIDAGDTFFVVDKNGNAAEVRVYIHFPPWNLQGTRYIATVPDASKDDNLLALPECPGK
jgi:hypothetical protein